MSLASRISAVFLVVPLSAASLQERIAAIAGEARGKVAVSCALPGSRLNCDLNAHSRPPMQSVFKLPMAVTALHRIERGELTLDQPVRFLASDRILPRTYSPLQEKYPAAEVDIRLRELLRLAVSLSDNAAADVVLRTLGGPGVVEASIRGLGISGFRLQDNEATLHRDVAAQYRNWWEPAGAVELLRRLSDHSPLTREHTELLLGWMATTPRGAQRIQGRLPAGTAVMHKAGTSGTDDGVAHATNDIGLVALPDGRRLAIAVFVTDSRADEATRDAVIAKIARAVWDEAVGQ
jgi:beta-lactamase class A